ncbi:MAG: AMP-binding protein [Sulfitobacter sp.]
MKLEERFRLHPQAEVVDLGAPSLATLIDCLNDGRTIHASQRSRRPITMGSGSEQWLECETSGSTGKPKTIRRSPESWMTSFDLAKTLFDVSERDHYAVLGSLGHSLSLFAALEALHIGAKLSVISEMSPKTQLQALQSRSVTVMYATPTQLRQLFTSISRNEDTPIKSVRRILVGGGKLFLGEQERIASLFPAANVTEFYGTSETSFVTYSGATTPSGSVGRLYPGVDVMISDNRDPTVCGEIRVRSPYLAEAYAGSIKDPLIQVDGFVSTGEIGYRDEDGFFFIKGRRDRMVTISDVNVYPEAIEQTVASFDGVKACAVVSKADDLRGNRTVCYVEALSDHFDLSELRRFCRERLGGKHVPKELLIIPAIPVLPSGKPDLNSLQELASAQK